MILLLFALLTISGNGTGGKPDIFGGGSGTSDGMDLQGGDGGLESVNTGDAAALSEAPASDISELAASLSLPDVSTTVELGNTLPASSLAHSSPATLTETIQSATGASAVGLDGFVGTSMKLRGTFGQGGAGGQGAGKGAGRGGGSGKGYGATPQSERAVRMALAYLAAHQKNNGSWNMGMGVCDNTCTHGIDRLDQHEFAATGLALLCFMGAGHTMHEGEYSENVSKGIYFLLQSLKPHSNGTSRWLDETAGAQMYEHGIATLALCEALQMTGDDSLREPCQNVVNYICMAQHTLGGWRYHPGQPGDLSVVSWQLLALKSAASAKLIVPTDVLQRTDQFVDSKNVNGHFYVYSGQSPTDSMSSIGNLIRLLRGAALTDSRIRRANDHFAALGPSRHDVYYNYYATQFMFHLGGKHWDTWNKTLQDFLVNTQVQQGHMAGSWYLDGNPFNHEGGRLYITTMCCLTLEVYYRYLPVYEDSVDEFLF